MSTSSNQQGLLCPCFLVLGVRLNCYVPSYTHTLHMTLQYDPAVALVPVVSVVALVAVVSVVCVVGVVSEVSVVAVVSLITVVAVVSVVCVVSVL